MTNHSDSCFPYPQLSTVVALYSYFVFLLQKCFDALSSSLSSSQLPPGPPSSLLSGVASTHPRSEFWKTYKIWGDKHGKDGVTSFHVWGRRIVVLNTIEAANALFVNRSTIYSDRPFPTMQSIMKRDKSIFFMKYSDRLKKYRKLMHGEFNATATKKYYPLQESESRLMLSNLLETPQYFENHLRKNAAATVMKMGFGINVKDHNDFFVKTAEESMRVVSLSAAPGRWLVDSLPILRYIPSWFPGATFKRNAHAWGQQLSQQAQIPHDFVKEEMAKGVAPPSFTSEHLSRAKTEEDEDIVQWTAGALYVGGSDTTVTIVNSFAYYMMAHPEVQAKVQAELDEILGNSRLPTIADRPLLPYLNSVILEVMRIAPSAPMGLPRAPNTDDVYKGMSIPKGCTVIANVWAILHDANLYPKPFEFNPDRFNGPSPQPDPRDMGVFGFSRRACPGRNFAESSVFIQCASIMSVFNVEQPIGPDGKQYVPKAEFTTGNVSFIKPFPHKLTERNIHSVELIKSSLGESN